MIDAKTTLPDVQPDQDTRPERAKPVFWQTIIRRFPQLGKSEIAVIQAFHEFPYLTNVELGKMVGLSRPTVSAIKNAEWFGEVLLAFALQRSKLFTARTAGVDEFLLNRIASKTKSPAYFPDGDELRFLELANKRAGLIAPDAHLHFDSGGGDQQVTIVTERLRQALESVNVTPTSTETSDTVPAELSKQLTEAKS